MSRHEATSTAGTYRARVTYAGTRSSWELRYSRPRLTPMTFPDTAESNKPSYWSRLGIVAQAIVFLLATMWAIEAIDQAVLSDRLQGNGISPRKADGLDGILWAPFLHGGWRHLVSNSFPFVILGGLVGLRGPSYWFKTFVFIIIVGGGLTWLFAGGSNHIGASGVVFGFFGSLMGAAVFERRIAVGATALVAIMLYGGIISGLAPQPGISWEGHLFGVIAGVLVSKVLAEPRKPKRILEEPSLDDPYWEVE